MEHLTRKSSTWLGKTTAAKMIPLLLAQVLIVLVCVPETLKADTEIRRDSSWEELPPLRGEQNVTLRLSEGGAVRGDVVAVQDNGIHLDRITMATDRERFPGGVDAMIPRTSVKGIRIEKMRGSLRRTGAVALGILGGYTGLGLWLADPPAINAGAGIIANVGLIVGGAYLGHALGKRKDRETTIITIVD